MQKTFPKIYATIILAMLVLSTIFVAIPAVFADTITGRPTIYVDTLTADPLYVDAGTYVNVTIEGMTITGAIVWLWLSTYGGAEINTALGDRWYAGPFYMGDVVGAVAVDYSFTPPEPFAQEGRTYYFVVGNYWINGTVPFMVQGEDVDYWIKIADISPRDYIVPTEVGVSQNRIRFDANFFATPLEGAPNTEVTISGYATPSGELYNITQDTTLVYGLVPSELHAKDEWNWTGFSKSFNVMDLEGRVTFPLTPPQSGTVAINVIENATATTVATFSFTQYYREVYVPDPTFRGHGGDYTGVLTLETGSEYNTTLWWFPAFGSASIYLNTTLMAGPIALNGTGAVYNYTITCPDLATGDYWFRVIDNHAVEYNFTIHVEMVPYILVDPTSGYIGDPFTVIGRNFLDYVGDYITIYFEYSEAAPYDVLLANFTVPAASWSKPLTVPHSAGGDRSVEAREIDGVTLIDATTFTVLPKIEVVPSEFANDGSLVYAVGTGFDPTKYYAPNIDNSFLGVNYYENDWPTNVVANDTGDILIGFVAAGFRPGLHVLSLYPVGADFWKHEPVFALFTVTTEGDPIIDFLISMNATIVDIKGEVAIIETTVGNLSVSLDAIDAKIMSIQEGVATIETTLGTVQTSLSDLDAKLVSLDGDVATIGTAIGDVKTTVDSIGLTVESISGDTATIKTDLGTISGKITSIEGSVATIKTDVGTVKVDVSDVKGQFPVTVDMTPVWIAVVLSLVAAIAAGYAAVTISRKIAG